MRLPHLLTSALAVSLAVTVASCGSGSSRARPPAAMNLAGVCPATVVVQTDWEPEAEYSAVYHLIGPGYSIDEGRRLVSGPLTIDGIDTGVKIEVRAGGASLGFQPVQSVMYQDKTITLGMVTTDLAVTNNPGQPVTAVVAPLAKDPSILMWDPASHPDWTSIADIGKTNAKVLVSVGTLFTAQLVKEGLLKQSQIDASYTGSTAEFTTNPTVAQEGFATAEPYIYEHEVPAWDKPVKYQLAADLGYNVYPEALSVRTGDLGSLAPCLQKLVPILQKSQVEYLNNPAATDTLIVNAVRQYNDGWTYSEGVANYAAQTMRSLKIVANDTSGPVGGMDLSRVQSVIDTTESIFKSHGGTVKSGLKASDIATNQFIDKTIVLP